MSMFATAEDLYKAKAEYYMGEAERLSKENVVYRETLMRIQNHTLEMKMKAVEDKKALEEIGTFIMNGKDNLKR